MVRREQSGEQLAIEFSAEDMARTRFAVSPLWEVVASVRVLKGADGQGLHRRWTERVRPALAAAKLDLAPLFDLIALPTRGIPGFLVPPPTTPQPSLDVELATLRGTTRAELRRTTTKAALPRVDELCADPDRGLGRLAEVIAAYWEVALAPHWARIRALCEADIRDRAARFADGGARSLFSDLGPRTAWDSGTLRLEHGCLSGLRHLADRGLLLCPSAFVWPRVFVTLDEHEPQPAVRYPPRGVGTLWEPRPCRRNRALAAVLGRTRALLLAELAAPASTTGLAHRTGLSPGGVSQHLTALRDAGLVSAHRTGRVVLYARTRVAEALVEGERD
ncbi:DUF5937 family protein [Streptomyces sp. NPDC048172]|uniref:DUF5937 family protein n=1 Tax=Streptomyces sp. NPDC048172 TaxID=3365505 RepID=UPI00372158AA